MTDFELKLKNDLTAELDCGNKNVLQSVLRAEKIAPKKRRGMFYLTRLAVPLALVLVVAIWALPLFGKNDANVFLSGVGTAVYYSYDPSSFKAGVSDSLRDSIAPMPKAMTTGETEDIEESYFVSAVCPYTLKNAFISKTLSGETQPIYLDDKKVAIGFTTFLTAEQIEKYADVFYFELA